MSGVTFNSNIKSLRAQRMVNESSNQLSQVFERLSSGQRINKASDDAAGLAISKSLQLDETVFRQGVRNVNDGVSILNVADGALESLTNIVVRVKELAAQAANGALSNAQREALDMEAQKLSQEFVRISRSTSFNGITVFDGSVQNYRIQAGYGVDGGIASGLGGSLGNGTFSGYTTYASQTNTNRITLGDLNNDGHLDMVSNGNNGVTGFVSIRLGAGDGTFGSSISYVQESSQSFEVVLGDVNNDGVLDLVTSGTEDTLHASVTIRLGVGDGTFGSSISVGYTPGSGGMRGVALGDINDDGKLDIVAVKDTVPGYFYTFLGNGNGTFGSARSVSLGASVTPYAVMLDDLNQDGVLDMVAVVDNAALTGGIAVSLGQGDGTFGPTTLNTPANFTARDLDIGDFNNDGKTDTIVALTNGSSILQLGNGDGSFRAPVSFVNGTTSTYGVKAIDLNGDGNLDFLTTDLTGGLSEGTFVRLGNGDGTFNAVRSYTSLSGITGGIAAGDLNEDGVVDVVVNASGNAIVKIQSAIQGISAILPFSLKTVADARQALAPIQRKLDQLNSQRGTVGAFQSRLGVALNLLTSTSDNLQAATARILDADVAKETADMVRLKILQNSASAILAQANSQPEIALRLLKA